MAGAELMVPQAVRRDLLAVPNSPRQSLDDAISGVTVHRAPAAGDEDRAAAALTHVEVERPGRSWRQWNGDVLAALALDLQCAMTTLDPRDGPSRGGVGVPR